MDDKTKRGGLDRKLISLREDYEVRYWTQVLGVSQAELKGPEIFLGLVGVVGVVIEVRQQQPGAGGGRLLLRDVLQFFADQCGDSVNHALSSPTGGAFSRR